MLKQLWAECMTMPFKFKHNIQFAVVDRHGNEHLVILLHAFDVSFISHANVYVSDWNFRVVVTHNITTAHMSEIPMCKCCSLFNCHITNNSVFKIRSAMNDLQSIQGLLRNFEPQLFLFCKKCMVILVRYEITGEMEENVITIFHEVDNFEHGGTIWAEH